MADLTLDELKEHCIKTMKMCEVWASRDNTSVKDSKTYQEHKMVLDLIVEHEERVKKVE